MVDGWIKGQYRRDGVDYFSTGPGMTGTVVSGRFGFTSHLYDPDFSGDLPKWTETVTGTFWGIKLPGYGPIFKEAGNIRQSAEVKYDSVLDCVLHRLRPAPRHAGCLEVRRGEALLRTGLLEPQLRSREDPSVRTVATEGPVPRGAGLFSD